MQGRMGKAGALGLMVGLKRTGQTNLVLPKYFTHRSYSSLSAWQLRQKRKDPPDFPSDPWTS